MVLSVFTILPISAGAVASVDMNIDYSPTSLVSEGRISLHISVSNNGDAIEQASIIVDGRTVANLGSVSSGETREWSDENYQITSSKLGQDILVETQFVYNGETQTVSRVINVAKK